MANQTLEKLSVQFLASVPVRDLDYKNLPLEHEEGQKKLVDCTVNHPLCQKYKLSQPYCTAFMKALMTHIESNGWTLSDLIFEAYGTLLYITDSHKHYRLPNNGLISLKEPASFIQNGTTGLRTWQAAFYLTEWLYQNLPLFSSKSVLELGSGLGFVGLSLSSLTNLSKCIITDHHTEVLEVLKENININSEVLKTRPIVECLDWEEVYREGLTESQRLLFSDTQIIIASDVIYDDRIIKPFVKTLIKVIETSSHDVGVYIASTIRRQETYNLFLSALEKEGLDFVKIEFQFPDASNFYLEEKMCCVEILKITHQKES